MQLQTERLLLREFASHDVDAVFAFESDPTVVAYVCYGPSTKEECRQELAFHIAHQRAQPRQFYHLAVIVAHSGQLIGWCGVKITRATDREGEVGYALHQAYWGHGYATEAVRAVIAFGFWQLQLHRIVGACHPANRGSIRVLEKVGMRYEGCLREQKWCKGTWRSTNLYALLDNEWKEGHAATTSGT